ncbi:MAG: four helix bundle protein [Chloroflexota bacterium]|nr:MAG: four helix bundle protein [Chloroflexota bacterium]
MAFKFERLEVWQIALEYIDVIYEIGNALPKVEEYNLKSQIIRAATSIALNIAEGSTSQTNDEQARFLGFAIRSLIETVACLRIIERRQLVTDHQRLAHANTRAETLAAKLHTLRKTIAPEQKWLRDEQAEYLTNE